MTQRPHVPQDAKMLLTLDRRRCKYAGPAAETTRIRCATHVHPMIPASNQMLDKFPSVFYAWVGEAVEDYSRYE